MFENVCSDAVDHFKIGLSWGGWVAQLGQHPTRDLGSGCDLTVVGSSPTLGSVMDVKLAWDSLPLLLSCMFSFSLSLSLSQKKKKLGCLFLF